MKIKKNIKGLWFYGFSGSGKSYLSKILHNRIKNKKTFIIDGDAVRKYISNDLDYNIRDRKIQILRILGISNICLQNHVFPVISTVYMNQPVFNLASKLKIKVIRLVRFNIGKKSKIYLLKNNVVGKDLRLPTLNTKILINDGSKFFWKKLIKYIH